MARVNLFLSDEEAAKLDILRGQIPRATFAKKALLDALEKDLRVDEVSDIKAVVTGAPLEDVFKRDIIKKVNDHELRLQKMEKVFHSQPFSIIIQLLKNNLFLLYKNIIYALQ